MALGSKIVNLFRLRVLHDAYEVCRISHVAVMENEAQPGVVWVLIKMVDAAGIER